MADGDTPRHAKESRRRKIAKPILMIGLLLLIIGISGIFWLLLPQSGTVLLAEDSYIRLDGRYLGHISGRFSKSDTDLRDVYIDFSILDQHNWDIKTGHSNGSIEDILRRYSSHGEPVEFSANLPASEAYYLYLLTVQPLPNQTGDGYAPIIRVEIHWDIWGPEVDFARASTAVFLLGIAFAVYGDHAWQNRLGGFIYSGWKGKGV